MLMAVVIYMAHRWATPGKTAIDGKTLVEGIFVIVVIAMLDQGKTEGVAKGFAWLFLTVAALTALPTLGKIADQPAPKKKTTVM
jgi:hypothetical protein